MMSAEVTEIICLDHLGWYFLLFAVSGPGNTSPVNRELVAISTSPASGVQVRRLTTSRS
jgi:hypothetical protein